MTPTISKKEYLCLADTLMGVLHPETQETFDNLLNGIACHYERLGKGVTTPHAADKYTLEYTYRQLRSLFNSELTQALKELKEEVIGEVPGKMNTDNWKYDRRVAELKLWQHQAIDNKIKQLEEV